jgi:hypothetical protein
MAAPVGKRRWATVQDAFLILRSTIIRSTAGLLSSMTDAIIIELKIRN